MEIIQNKRKQKQQYDKNAALSKNKMHNFGKLASNRISRAARHRVYVVKLLELLINEKLHDIQKASEKNQSGGDSFVYLYILMQ